MNMRQVREELGLFPVWFLEVIHFTLNRNKRKYFNWLRQKVCRGAICSNHLTENKVNLTLLLMFRMFIFTFADCLITTSSFYFVLAPSMTLGLSLSAPTGMLQQAFSKMREARIERSNTLDPPAAEQEPGPVQSNEAGIGPNSNLAPPEVSTTGTSFPAVSLSSTATSSPPASTGRVSPPPISAQSQTTAPVTSDHSPAPQSSHEAGPSQHPPAAVIPPSSSTISPPSVQTSVPAVTGPQSSVAGVTPSSTGTVPATEQQPFNSAVSSSQPMSSSIHAAQHNTSQPVTISSQPPPPASLPSQSQVQPQPVEAEGADLQTKTAGRDDIQALDKKLRSLFKDQSSASSSSMDPSQNTGTSSPPAGTASPPPGAAMVPPSNLPLTSGMQGVLGPTTTPGHAQTPPTKPRAQVRGNFIQE